jgi:hypothetical protein
VFKSRIASSLIAAVGLMASGAFATAPLPQLQHYKPSRSRQRGQPGRPGAKLARKAARGQIGRIHGGLSPRMPDRFPFSAKRR